MQIHHSNKLYRILFKCIAIFTYYSNRTFKIIYMVQERVSGNGNFDIDAITRLVNTDASAPAIMDQPFIDPAADAFAADVQETADQIRYNPGSSLVEEAAQLMNAPGAAKLGAGVMADLRAAVQLQEEKAANGADAFMRGDRVWEERKERDDKDRKEQARIADMADDANNGQLSTTPDRYGLSQQNYAELNDELKTRDGQDRFMNFMRMMNPDMSDADLRRYVEDAQTIAAVRSNQATPDQRRAYEGMSPARRDEVSRSMRDFQAYEPVVAAASDANVENIDGSIEESFNQARTTYDSGGPTRATSIPAATSFATPPISVASTLDDRANGATPPISVASTLDDRANGATTLSLTSTFRSAASPDQPAPVAMASPAIAPQLAANTVDVGLANM